MRRVALFLVCVLLADAIHSAAGAAGAATTNYMSSTEVFQKFRIYTGDVAFSKVGNRSNCPLPPYTAEQIAARVQVVKVIFDRTFKKTPAVTYSVSVLDTDKNYNLRCIFTVREITTKGFTVVCETWCDSYVYNARVTYWVFAGAVSKGLSDTVT